MHRNQMIALAALILALAPACRKQAFPDVNDLNTVQISLRRTICPANCPSYTLQILGNGAVTFEGRDDVAMPGYQHGKISPEKVRLLLEEFRKVDFYSLRDSYEVDAPTKPYYTVTLTIDGNTKKIVDHDGTRAGMPPAMTALENAIDHAAGAERWIGVR